MVLLVLTGTGAHIRSCIVVLVLTALVSTSLPDTCTRSCAGSGGMSARESFVLIMGTIAFMAFVHMLRGT